MNLIKDSFIYVLGEIVSKGIPFLMLPYLTRALGTDGFADYSFYMSIYIVVGLIYLLSQDGSIARYYFVYGKRGQLNLVFTGLLTSTSLLCISICFIFIIDCIMYLPLLLAAYFNVNLQVQLRLKQCRKEAMSYIKIQIASGFFTSLCTIYFINSFSLGPFSFFYATALINFILYIYCCSSFYKKNIKYFKLNKKIIKLAFGYLIALGLPTLVHQMSFFMKGYLDRIFVYNMFSSEVMANYAAGFQLASVVSVLLMAINKAINPYLYKSLQSKEILKADILKYTKKSLKILPIVFLFIVLIPNSLFVFFLGAEYGGSSYFAKIFAIGFMLTLPYLILVNFLFFRGRNIVIAKVSVTSSIIYIGLMMLFINIEIKLVPLALIMSNILMIFLLYRVIKGIDD